jgi:hypothetical protein
MFQSYVISYFVQRLPFLCHAHWSIQVTCIHHSKNTHLKCVVQLYWEFLKNVISSSVLFVYRQPSKQHEDWFYLNLSPLKTNITHAVETVNFSLVVYIPFGSSFLKSLQYKTACMRVCTHACVCVCVWVRVWWSGHCLCLEQCEISGS